MGVKHYLLVAQKYNSVELVHSLIGLHLEYLWWILIKTLLKKKQTNSDNSNFATVEREDGILKEIFWNALAIQWGTEWKL